MIIQNEDSDGVAAHERPEGSREGAAEATLPFFCQNVKCNDHGTDSCDAHATLETCNGEGNDQKPTCYAVWSNSSETGVKMLLKGCWLDHGDCQEDVCSTGQLQSSKDRGAETYFCCCKTTNCNREVFFIPRTQTTTALPVTNGSQPATKGGTQAGTVLFATLVPLCLVALLILALYFFYRRCRVNKEKLKKPLQMVTVGAPPQPTVKYQIKSLISRGRYGAVYKAVLEDESLVAVKVFPSSDRDSWVQEQDIYQVPLLASHDNILHFISVDVSLSEPREYLLFSEYQQNESLYDYIKTHMVSFKEMLHISTGLLRGLAFLHEEKHSADGRQYKPVIVHRDFKSRNVLLKKDLTACVSDFGLAIKCDNGRTPKDTHGQVGTRRYMAPEVLEGATEFSAFAFKQIDVYAAALVIWELLSRCTVSETPVEEYKLPFEEEVGVRPSLEDMYDVVVAKNLRPVIKQSWIVDVKMSVICQTVQELWDFEFEARITAGTALERLQALDQPLNSVSLSSLSFNDRAPSSHHETTPLIITDPANSSSIV